MSLTFNKVRCFRLTAALLIMTSACSPAFAVNKDMVQLQTQVQQLLDAVARLQQSNDERMGVLKDLIQQNADSVNRMSVNMDALQKQMTSQAASTGAKVDQVSGQVQAINDSLDELKARMNRLEKVLADVQTQQQSMGAALGSMPQGTGPATSAPPVSPAPVSAPPTTVPPASSAAAITPPRPGTVRTPVAPVKDDAPQAEELYKSAYSDFMAARYPVAAAEFSDVIKHYPDNPVAGTAHYYLGEIDYRAGKYAAAARDYDKVVEQFPDNSKVPAAHLHKGQALIELKQNDAGVRELRTLIQRFPNSPEASQARSKLNAMGVAIKPKL